MKKLYAIQLKDENFFCADEKNIIPALYASIKEAESDMEWIDDERNPIIVEIEVKIK